MKKISITLIIAIILAAMLSNEVFAASPTSSLVASPSSIHAGDTVTVTVKISNCSSTSLGVIPSYDTTNFELVSGEWLLSGAVMSDFSDGCGVIAYTNAYSFNGNVFKFVLKAKSGAKVSKYTVKCEVSAEGYSVVNPSTAISIVCKTHSYSSWEKSSDTQHKHTCTACGYVETKTHTWDSGKVTKAASCKETGIKEYKCTTCGAVKTETLAKTTTHTFGAWSTTKKPTCAAKGTQTRTCSVCGKTETKDIAVLGHSYGEWKTTKEPTCTAKGVKTRVCSSCQKVETKDIAALGHSFSKATVTKKPTCTKSGIETGKCTRCGKESTNEIPATGHIFDDKTITKEATCTETGIETGVCKVCGAKEEIEIPAKGHTFGEPVVTKAPTETEEGVQTKTCTVCGETEEETIPVKPADKPKETEDEKSKGSEEETPPENDQLPVIWIAVGIVAVAAVAVATVIIVKKKK